MEHVGAVKPADARLHNEEHAERIVGRKGQHAALAGLGLIVLPANGAGFEIDLTPLETENLLLRHPVRYAKRTFQPEKSSKG